MIYETDWNKKRLGNCQKIYWWLVNKTDLIRSHYFYETSRNKSSL